MPQHATGPVHVAVSSPAGPAGLLTATCTGTLQLLHKCRAVVTAVRGNNTIEGVNSIKGT